MNTTFLDRLFRLIGIALLLGALTILLCALFALPACGQTLTNTQRIMFDVPASSTQVTNVVPEASAAITPQSAEQHFFAWAAVFLTIGAYIRHYVGKFVVWVTPWAKAHGGLFRGMRDWFWDANWHPPTKPESPPGGGPSVG